METPTYGPLLLRILLEADVLGPLEQAHLRSIQERILARAASALRRGVVSGQLREISVPHTLRTLSAAILCHFAGEAAGSAEQARIGRQQLFLLLEQGLAAAPLADRSV